MKPPPFDYHRATSVAEVLDILAADPEGNTKVLAGGQSLLTLMNLRLARPTLVIDIGALAELARVFDDADRVVLGALVRHRTMERDTLIGDRLPLAAEAARHIGHVGIRNRGTLGGALAHADPAAEFPAVMTVLGATVHAESASRGRRDIAADDFFLSLYTSTLEADELVTWVSVPTLGPTQGWGFREYAPRLGDYALAGAACVVDTDGSGLVTGMRTGLISAGERPVLHEDRERFVGDRGSDRLWRIAARAWAKLTEPPGDDPEYLRVLHEEAMADSLAQAYRRATHPPITNEAS